MIPHTIPHNSFYYYYFYLWLRLYFVTSLLCNFQIFHLGIFFLFFQHHNTVEPFILYKTTLVLIIIL